MSGSRLERNNSRHIQKLLIYNPVRAYLQRKAEAPKVLGGFSLPSGANCIEIGCGHGAGTLLISRHFDCGRIVGVDNDPETIERARSYVAHPPAWAKGIRTDQIEFACKDLATIRVPVVCTYGSRSPDSNAGWIRALASVIPTARTQMIEGGGSRRPLRCTSELRAADR